MKEDLYATLFEETDVSGFSAWNPTRADFEISVMRLTDKEHPEHVEPAEQGFYQLDARNPETDRLQHIADFASLEDAQAAIVAITKSQTSIERCLNDRGRYCYTVWSTLLDISIKGALDKAGFDPDMETHKMRALLMGLGERVQHETHGDLAARALFAASQFFNWLTTPGKAA